MKLICCVPCGQTFSLSHQYSECKGGHGGGQYVDRVNAKIWGDREEIFVLGFTNSSFSYAIGQQLQNGDSDIKMPYAGRTEAKGRDFTAFVIPESASSIQRVDSKFDPI